MTVSRPGHVMKTTSLKCQGPRLLLIALACGICSCSSTSPTAMPNKNWWNFYQRGVQHLAEGDFRNARTDFEIAIGKRPGARFGNDQDRWRELTYGLHVIENYFPNRELGVTLHNLGDHALAETYLATSLEQTPSARAKHYLNAVRTERLKTSVIPAPRVEIAGTTPGWTSQVRLQISGTAKAGARIREVRIGETAPLIELAPESYAFDEIVSLRPGTNEVLVSATDLKGQITTVKQTWIADWQKPRLIFADVLRQGRDYHVKAILTDDHALKWARVSGAKSFTGDHAVPTRRWEVPFVVRSGSAGVTIEAEDLAGNRFHTLLTEGEFASCGPGPAHILLASAEGGSIPNTTGKAGDAGVVVETLRPGVRLEGTGRVVHKEHFFIDGWVEDASGLQKVTLSGEDLLGGEKGARRYYFSRLVNLEEGENRFELQAVDSHGNETRKVFEVTLKVPAHQSSRYRLSLGVPPVLASRDDDMGRRARAALKASIAHERPRFRLLTRDEALEGLLLEQEISLSSLSEEHARLNIRFGAADLLLLTQFIYEPGGITFFGSAVDTEAGEIICYEDVYTELPDSYPELKRKALGLVLQIEQQFPLVEGTVTEISGSGAVLNIGTREGIRDGMRFVASRPGASGFPGEGVIQVNDQWVELKATSLDYDTCRANILPRDGKRALRTGDKVFAR